MLDARKYSSWIVPIEVARVLSERDFDMNPKYYKPGVKLGKTKINYTYETKRNDNDRRS